MTEPAIHIDNVKKRYGAVEVLRGITLEVKGSSFTSVIGKSGSGKSTLLAVMAGLEQPDEGSISVLGKDISALSSDELAHLRRRLIGIVFQGFNLIPSLTAIENVLLPAAFEDKATAARRRRRAEGLLGKVGLAERFHHRPAALSGGEQQRVAIARALINEPAILLADEPTGNLDEATGASVLELLRGLCCDSGVTLLAVTHDPDIAASADRVIEIKDGRYQV